MSQINFSSSKSDPKRWSLNCQCKGCNRVSHVDYPMIGLVPLGKSFRTFWDCPKCGYRDFSRPIPNYVLKQLKLDLESGVKVYA